MCSPKERKKTGHPGYHIGEGIVKEIEREVGISKWGRACTGTLYKVLEGLEK